MKWPLPSPKKTTLRRGQWRPLARTTSKFPSPFRSPRLTLAVVSAIVSNGNDGLNSRMTGLRAVLPAACSRLPHQPAPRPMEMTARTMAVFTCPPFRGTRCRFSGRPRKPHRVSFVASSFILSFKTAGPGCAWMVTCSRSTPPLVMGNCFSSEEPMVPVTTAPFCFKWAHAGWLLPSFNAIEPVHFPVTSEAHAEASHEHPQRASISKLGASFWSS